MLGVGVVALPVGWKKHSKSWIERLDLTGNITSCYSCVTVCLHCGFLCKLRIVSIVLLGTLSASQETTVKVMGRKAGKTCTKGSMGCFG